MFRTLSILLNWVCFNQNFVNGIVNSWKLLERVHRFCSVVIGVCYFINEVSEKDDPVGKLLGVVRTELWRHVSL